MGNPDSRTASEDLPLQVADELQDLDCTDSENIACCVNVDEERKKGYLCAFYNTRLRIAGVTGGRIWKDRWPPILDDNPGTVGRHYGKSKHSSESRSCATGEKKLHCTGLKNEKGELSCTTGMHLFLSLQANSI